MGGVPAAGVLSTGLGVRRTARPGSMALDTREAAALWRQRNRPVGGVLQTHRLRLCHAANGSTGPGVKEPIVLPSACDRLADYRQRYFIWLRAAPIRAVGSARLGRRLEVAGRLAWTRRGACPRSYHRSGICPRGVVRRSIRQGAWRKRVRPGFRLPRLPSARRDHRGPSSDPHPRLHGLTPADSKPT